MKPQDSSKGQPPIALQANAVQPLALQTLADVDGPGVALRAQLRDPAEDVEAVNRLWTRIESSTNETGRADVVFERPTRSWRNGRVLLLAACFSSLAFVGGVLVGRVDLRDTEDARPRAANEDNLHDSVFATGSLEKSFVLPNGSALTLKPDSLVEVLRTSPDSMTLSLLRGGVSIEASEGQSFAVLAGEARVTAAAGSHVSLTRNAEDVDVRVAQGEAEVSSPAGRHRIEQGQSMASVPTYAWMLSQRQPSPSPAPDEEALTPTPTPTVAHPKTNPEDAPEVEVVPIPAAPPAPVASLRNWLALATQGKYDDAFDALQEGVGFETTLATAQSATELTALSEIAGRKHPALRLRALHRAADEFAGEADGRAAAAELALLYQQSNRELAAKYRQIGSQASALAETLHCSELRGFTADSNPVERRHLAARALEYATTYPKGTCSEQAAYILAETKADVPPEPAASATSTASGAASSAPNAPPESTSSAPPKSP